MRYAYPCKIKQGSDGGYSVRFPDVYGANTGGDTYAEAKFQAHDCLVAALRGYLYHDWDFPLPSKVKKGQELIPVPALVAAKMSVYTAMRQQGISNAALAQQLGLSEAAVKKLVHPDFLTPWSQLDRARELLGCCRLVVEDLAA